MVPNRFAFIALAFSCVAAAFAGGYVASRQTVVPVPTAAQGAPTPAPARPSPVPDQAEARVEPKPAPAPTTRGVTPTPPRPTVVQQRQAPGEKVESAPISIPAAPQASPVIPLSSPVEERTSPIARATDVVPAAEEPVRAPEPPARSIIELVVPANAVIGLQTENRLSSETAHVEDRIDGRVVRDVKVGDRVAIPAGSRLLGSVTQVDLGGKVKERARLGFRFNTLVLPDGTRLPINTETVIREGEAPGDSSAAKIGGTAVGGAIIGAILGGAKGAAIGAAAGAGGGAAAVAAGDRKPATLAAGTQLTIRIVSPVSMTVEE